MDTHQNPSQHRRPIYVESRIRASIDDLWRATQEPDRHQRWDVRFGEIEYLPHVEGEPQQFRYATTVAPGLTVAGTGETLGERDRPDGSRWSGLKFRADDWRSIIGAGAGYWRYVPTDDGVRFLTRYDYRPRWGHFGEWLDRVAFRPLFGWATAWSFDRLRLWLEDGTPPETARNHSVAHAVAAGAVSGIWLYHGLVPKLWNADADELTFWTALGLGTATAKAIVRATGAGEVALGAATARWSNRRWPFLVAALSMPALTVAAGIADRRSITRAFNPVTLNVATAALAVVALATHSGRPSGRTPLREAPDRQPDVGALP
jgi:hypothetical protein